jgi:hypothetical protein
MPKDAQSQLRGDHMQPKNIIAYQVIDSQSHRVIHELPASKVLEASQLNTETFQHGDYGTAAMYQFQPIRYQALPVFGQAR